MTEEEKKFAVVADSLISPYMTNLVGPLRVLHAKMTCKRMPDGTFHYVYKLRGELKDLDPNVTVTLSTQSTYSQQTKKDSQTSFKSKGSQKSFKSKNSQKSLKKSPQKKKKRAAKSKKDDSASSSTMGSQTIGLKKKFALTKDNNPGFKNVKFVLYHQNNKIMERCARFSERANLKDVLKFFHMEFSKYLKEGFLPRMAMLIEDSERSLPLQAKMGESTLRNLLWEKKNLTIIADGTVLARK